MPKSSRQPSLPGMEPSEDVPAEPAQLPAAEVPLPSAVERTRKPQTAITRTAAEDSSSIQGWEICAVDAHSLIFQVFHALPEMTSPRGEPVGAVYGFIRDILQLLETRRPDALVCAFDLPGPTFRHELYPDYKADRGEMPADLASQIPKIRTVLEALGVPVLSNPGFEADDVLATLARLCDEQGANCLVITGDKDCRQLITEHVALYNIRKNAVYDAQSLRDDWGIRPDQVVDFQALVGDKVDCVPGVPLIGPKIASELLATYGTLDEVLDHAQEVAGAKRKQNLIDYREDALLSRALVQLDAAVPITPDWQAARPGKIDLPGIAQLFQEYGFRSLLERVAALAGDDTAPAAARPAKYQLINSREGLADLVAQLKSQPLISIDTETTHVAPRYAKIVGYAIAYQPHEAFYLPVLGPPGEQVLDGEEVAQALRPILENPQVAKIGQNLKYDLVVLRGAGIRLAGVHFDTMLASYLLDAGGRSHNLDQLAQRYLDHTTTKIETLIGTGKNQRRMDQVPVAAVAAYAAEDADLPLQLHRILEKKLRDRGLEQLNADVEVPLVEVLADLEYHGIYVDSQRLDELSVLYGQKLHALAAEIEQLAGHPLNINSPKQLSQLLFEELGLPVVKKTKTGASTDASVLEELAPLHPLPAKILEHRQYSKLLNTYVDALPAMVHPETGRVHASFNQVVAATGRLSSSNPNLQNIPIRTAAGREIRSAFRAGPAGWKLLAADYSQIELRVLAHYTGDEALCQAFADDQDIHALVASQVAGVALPEVTSAMRRQAKAVNFGILYGQSPFGLAKGLGITSGEATEFIDNYFARYPRVLDFFTETLTACRKQGYVSTLLGRRRDVDGIRPVPPQLREPKTGVLRQLNLPERTAINTVIQGSAADLIKLAMLGVHRKLSAEKIPAQLLLQIHDELVFEVAEQALPDLAALVTTEMTQVMPLAVPLQVDIKYGENWADCQPWTM